MVAEASCTVTPGIFIARPGDVAYITLPMRRFSCPNGAFAFPAMVATLSVLAGCATSSSQTAVPEIVDGSSLLFVGKDRVDRTYDAFLELLERAESGDRTVLRSQLNRVLFQSAKIRERVLADLPKEEFETLKAYASARLDSLGTRIVDLSNDLYAATDVADGEMPQKGCSYCAPIWGGFCHRRCCIDADGGDEPCLGPRQPGDRTRSQSTGSADGSRARTPVSELGLGWCAGGARCRGGNQSEL